MNKHQNKLIFIMSFLAIMLLGCTKGGDGTGMFEMNSNTITVSTSNGVEFDITDEKIATEIREMCKNYNWTEVPEKDQLEGSCEIWINFNNNRAVIGMYKDKDYGYLEKTKSESGTPKYLPKGLNEYVQKLIQEKS